MRTVVAQDVVSASKFNRFHLLVFLWCFYAIGFDGFDIAMYGVGLAMDDGGMEFIPTSSRSSWQLLFIRDDGRGPCLSPNS